MRSQTEIRNLIATLCVRHNYDVSVYVHQNELHLDVKSEHEEWSVNLRSNKTGNIGGIYFTTRELTEAGSHWEELLINRFYSAMAKIDPPNLNKHLTIDYALAHLSNFELKIYLKELERDLLAMFRADSEAGCGFESDDEWRHYYLTLQQKANCNLLTTVHDPIDGDIQDVED